MLIGALKVSHSPPQGAAAYTAPPPSVAPNESATAGPPAAPTAAPPAGPVAAPPSGPATAAVSGPPRGPLTGPPTGPISGPSAGPATNAAAGIAPPVTPLASGTQAQLIQAQSTTDVQAPSAPVPALANAESHARTNDSGSGPSNAAPVTADNATPTNPFVANAQINAADLVQAAAQAYATAATNTTTNTVQPGQPVSAVSAVSA